MVGVLTTQSMYRTRHTIRTTTISIRTPTAPTSLIVTPTITATATSTPSPTALAPWNRPIITGPIVPRTGAVAFSPSHAPMGTTKGTKERFPETFRLLVV
jgi:hypothetical protein